MICISLVTEDGISKQKPLTVRLSRVRMATSCFASLEATRGMSNCKRETSSKITAYFYIFFPICYYFWDDKSGPFNVTGQISHDGTG